jgi:xanthine/uracil/vitamin C permease (AzgA family)
MATPQPPYRELPPRPSSSLSGGIARPRERPLPSGYAPHYRNDLQVTGAIVRDARRTALTRKQIILLASGAVAVVIVVTAIAAIVLGSFVAQASIASPDSTLSTFYSSLRAQDYRQAYALTSSSYRAAQSEASFEDHYHQLDAIDGTITTFNVHVTANANGHATATVTLYRGGIADRQIVDTVQMKQSGGSWYVDAISSSLGAPSAS